MAFKLSTGLRNFVLQRGSIRDALQGGIIQIYSGTQPSSADAAPSGTLLATISAASVARVAEVLATGTATLAGASGSVDGMTVNGVEIMNNPVAFSSTIENTAAEVAAEINKSKSSPEYRASASGAVVTISALPGAGAGANTFAVVTATTTLTSTDVDLAGGVTSANGLRFGDAAAATLVKDANQTWSGVAVATGTAGWYRLSGAVADSEGLDSSESEIRVDGAIATSCGELNLPSTSITNAATQTVTQYQIALPSA